MQQKILFLLKNGIGFGHFRRSLVIANELRKQGHIIYFLTQSTSTDLFKNKGFVVFNIPFMNRLPNNLSEIFLKKMVEFLIEKVNPDIVIEDTYPDNIYKNLKSLQYRKKILISREWLADIAMLSYLVKGEYKNFDKIMILSSKDNFLSLKQIPKLKLWLKLSSQISFHGPVFHAPEQIDIDQVECKYIDGRPLIVFNAGAGGEHQNEGFCDKLFNSAIEVARMFDANKISAKIIIVKGSHYQKKLNIPSNLQNVVEVGYEALLPALFNIAKVCVLRPGYNSVHETLHGKAQAVLIPSISWHEEQDILVKDLEKQYNTIAVNPDYSVEEIAGLIVKSINFPTNRKPIDNYATNIANEIVKQEEKNMGAPVFIYSGENDLPDKFHIDANISYDNLSPCVNFYMERSMIEDNIKLNLIDRGILGIKMHKINKLQEAEYLFQKDYHSPLSIFCDKQTKKKIFDILNKYNRVSVSADDIASFNIKDVL